MRSLLLSAITCPLFIVIPAHAQSAPSPLIHHRAAAHVHAPDCDSITGCGKGDFYRSVAATKIEDEDPVGSCLAREAMDDTDLLHCNLDIEIIVSSPRIIGSNTFTVMSKVENLTEFTFRLRNNYTITSALINGATPVPVASPTATTRIATLDRAYGIGETFTLRIAYDGVPVSRGFGSIQFTTQNGFPLVTSLSEPYFAYTWWPCKDGDFGVAGDNSDKFTLEFAITAPENMRSIANGLLQGIDTLPGGKRRHRWAHNYPISTYLVAFASTVYNTHTYAYDYPGGSMPVEFNLYPANDTAANRNNWFKCIQMMETFRPIFGLYPFIEEKYGLYNFPFSGGMEHQTNSGQSGYGESLTAHELAHQWWGNHITLRNWHHIWLNEGFATYGEALWEERKPGSSGLPALHAAMNSRRPTSVNGTVYVPDPSDFNRIFSSNFSYRKGAWVLHQLRKVIGDEAFFETLLTYRAMFGGRTATTEDFAAVASAVHGEDLSWFFQQWIYMPGAPAYAFGFQNVTIESRHYVRMHVRQTQQASYGLYRMPVDVRLDAATGNTTAIISNHAQRQHYLIPVAAPITGLALDEFNWILATAKTAETYQIGPPKVVETLPAPGTLLSQGNPPGEIVITFSDNVAATSSDFTITSPSGPVPFTFEYAPALWRATLTPSQPLGPGVYTVRIRDTVQSIAGSFSLDGTLVDPADPASLPSGNGLPGGDAVFTFEIVGSTCYPNCDGSTAPPILNIDDFTCYINEFALGQSLPHPQQIAHYANCDGSTAAPVLNIDDFTCFINAFALGCP